MHHAVAKIITEIIGAIFQTYNYKTYLYTIYVREVFYKFFY